MTFKDYLYNIVNIPFNLAYFNNSGTYGLAFNDAVDSLTSIISEVHDDFVVVLNSKTGKRTHIVPISKIACIKG